MKILDQNGRLFGKISIIDVMVLVVVAVLAVAVYIKSQKPQTGSGIETQTIVYQMKLENQPAYMLEAIQVGDQMFDKERSTGGSLGTVVAVESSPGTYQASLNDGTVESVPAEGYYNLLLTIEGSGLVDPREGYILNRIYHIGVNSKRQFNTQYAAFVGTIVKIQLPQGDAIRAIS